MYSDEDLLPISALQHLEFCPRRCALVHIERVWADNRFTAEGNLLHERVHEIGDEIEDGVRIARGLRLYSRTLGLYGVADVVEFHPVVENPPGKPSEPGVVLAGRPGLWQPFPVEYKRGKKRSELSHEIQLCAQALCLEEMLGVDVPAGALYFGKSRRRGAVALDASLREQTRRLAEELHRLIDVGKTPPPQLGAKCKSCSLAPLCLPHSFARRSAARYVNQSIAAILAEPRDEET